MGQLLKGVELAAALGVSGAQISHYKRKGQIAPEESGLYDLDKCRLNLSRLVKPKKGGTLTRAEQQQQRRKTPRLVTTPPTTELTPDFPLDSGVPSQSEIQRQRDWLKLQKEKREFDLSAGVLEEVGPLNAWAAGMIIRARDILLRIGPELRDRLAQETAPVKCDEMVTAEIARALSELSEYKQAA